MAVLIILPFRCLQLNTGRGWLLIISSIVILAVNSQRTINLIERFIDEIIFR